MGKNARVFFGAPKLTQLGLLLWKSSVMLQKKGNVTAYHTQVVDL